jgi:hypothetical protein
MQAVTNTAQARLSGDFAPLQRRELMQFDHAPNGNI